jgi:predicted esterase
MKTNQTKQTRRSTFSVRCWMFNVLLPWLLFLAALSTGFGQPVITQQPQSCTNVVGTTATFTVQATGTEPRAYQWQKLSADWTDLADRTNTALALTNVQTSDAMDYRVVVTNADGAVTSDVAHLTVHLPPTPPRITPTISLQHQAAHIGTSASFAVTASGTAPLSYQWWLDGHELPGKTGNTLTFSPAQPADEGDYTVVVTNVVGAVTSESARLWVVPPASAYIARNLTNSTGLRLPYYYFLPTNYSAARSYPLICVFHGTPGDETIMTNANPAGLGYLNYPQTKVFSSYRQQATNPMIVVWPTRRAGDSSWTTSYLQLASALLDRLLLEFNVDTNRIYVAGVSEGVHAAWDTINLRAGSFAAASLAAGWQGDASPAVIKNVPLWVWCAQDDDASQIGNTRSLVAALRRIGGSVIYTEYITGGHGGGIFMGCCNPAYVDWLLAQRRGVASINQPFLSITNPTSQAVLSTGATNLSLAGSAAALDRAVTQVSWTNFANNAKGVASGTNLWGVTNIPLVANKTNVVVVVGTTTSWAPAFGGNTTFNDTLIVIQSPIRATLTLQGTEVRLNWTGGGPPYRVQRATDLAVGDWAELLSNATPPLLLPLPLAGEAGFYRIVGQ